jgi:hypothetical protein
VRRKARSVPSIGGTSTSTSSRLLGERSRRSRPPSASHSGLRYTSTVINLEGVVRVNLAVRFPAPAANRQHDGTVFQRQAELAFKSLANRIASHFFHQRAEGRAISQFCQRKTPGCSILGKSAWMAGSASLRTKPGTIRYGNGSCTNGVAWNASRFRYDIFLPPLFRWAKCGGTVGQPIAFVKRYWGPGLYKAATAMEKAFCNSPRREPRRAWEIKEKRIKDSPQAKGNTDSRQRRSPGNCKT